MAATLLFGGSFDPIHHGHLLTARFVAEELGVARTILIPSAAPPHKLGKRLAPAEARLALCRAAVAGDAQFQVSEWELQQPGPNYTILTVRHFRRELGERERLCWLIGMDSLAELDTWRDIDALASECDLITAARPGFQAELTRHVGRVTGPNLERIRAGVLHTPLFDISATQIRARVRMGCSIRYLVPDAVAELIATLGLYRAGAID